MPPNQDDVSEIGERLLITVHATKRRFCALQEIIRGGLPRQLPVSSYPPDEKLKLFNHQRKKNGCPPADVAIYTLGEQSTPEQVALWADRNLLLICYFAIRADYTLAEICYSLLEFVRRESPDFELSLEAFLCLIEKVCDFLASGESSTRHEIAMLLPKCLQPSQPVRDRRRQFLDETDRFIAERKVEGWTPAKIAKMLALARSTLTRRFQRIEDRGGFQKCFFDIPPNPFRAPFARELFELCKKHKHPMSAEQANEIMKEVLKEADKIGCRSLINEPMIRKARNRKRSSETSAPSDAELAIRDAVQTALVHCVVQKKTLLERLMKGLQSSNLHFWVPEKKSAVTGSRRDMKERNSSLIRPPGTFSRDWVALKIAIRILDELDKECMPMGLKSNIG